MNKKQDSVDTYIPRLKDRGFTCRVVTTCPTCGGECEVKGNTTHYYVSKTKQLEQEKAEALRLLNESVSISSQLTKAIELLDEIKNHLKPVNPLYKKVLDFLIENKR